MKKKIFKTILIELLIWFSRIFYYLICFRLIFPQILKVFKKRFSMYFSMFSLQLPPWYYFSSELLGAELNQKKVVHPHWWNGLKLTSLHISTGMIDKSMKPLYPTISHFKRHWYLWPGIYLTGVHSCRNFWSYIDFESVWYY